MFFFSFVINTVITYHFLIIFSLNYGHFMQFTTQKKKKKNCMHKKPWMIYSFITGCVFLPVCAAIGL